MNEFISVFIYKRRDAKTQSFLLRLQSSVTELRIYNPQHPLVIRNITDET